jgi:glucoamylase
MGDRRFRILNEVYWPATGRPQNRDLGLIVAGEEGWCEVKRVNRYRISTPAPHVPLPCAVHEGRGYRLRLEFLPAPLRDALLVSYRLEGRRLASVSAAGSTSRRQRPRKQRLGR